MDFRSPAFSQVPQAVWDEDTDIDGYDEDGIQVLNDICPSVTAAQRRRIRDQANSQSRASVEELPDPEPAVSSGSSIAPRNSSAKRLLAYGRLSEDSEDNTQQETEKVKRNSKILKPKTKKKLKRIRKTSHSTSSSSESEPDKDELVRSAEKLVSVGHTEFADESDESFICSDHEVLYDDGRLIRTEDDPVPKRRKRRVSGKSDKSRIKSRRQNGFKKRDSDSSDSDAPIKTVDSDGVEEEEYVVERIVRKRKRNGVEEYFIKWKGWAEADNTWEPVGNLGNCPKKLREFEDKLKRMREEGKPTDNVDISEDDEDDSGSLEDDVDFHDAQEVLLDVLGKVGIHELQPVPMTNGGDLGDNMKCLRPRKWITNFVIDDTIISLLDLFTGNSSSINKNNSISNKHIVYLQHHFFSLVQRSVEQNGYIPNSVLDYLSQQKAGLAEVLIVCASTKTADPDLEAEHFVLGLVYLKDETIVLLDSIREKCREPRVNIFKALHAILTASRWLESVGLPTDVRYIYSRDCPQQKNSYDCGLFLIANVVMLLTGKQIQRSTIKSRILRRFVFSLMNKRQVVQPPARRTEELDNIAVLMGQAKRKAKEAASESEVQIERSNTNQMIIK